MKLRYFCLWTVVLALTLIFFAAACAAAAIKPTIAAGDNHTLSLQKDGSLWAWGYNDFGQLGLGDNTRRLTPVQVGTAKNWVAVAAGDTHSLGLRANGSLWAWGDNFHGQLGLGDDYPGYPDDCLIPTQVSGSRWGRPTRPNAGLDLLLLGN